MNNYTFEQIKKMRGIQALTQGEKRLEDLLVENVNKLGKACGVASTRTNLLMGEFDKDALENFVQIAIDLKDVAHVSENYIKQIMKELCERIFRDHVALEIAETFRLFVVKKMSANNWDTHSVVGELVKYLTSGSFITVTEVYLKVCKKMKDGVL